MDPPNRGGIRSNSDCGPLVRGSKLQAFLKVRDVLGEPEPQVFTEWIKLSTQAICDTLGDRLNRG